MVYNRASMPKKAVQIGWNYAITYLKEFEVKHCKINSNKIIKPYSNYGENPVRFPKSDRIEL